MSWKAADHVLTSSDHSHIYEEHEEEWDHHIGSGVSSSAGAVLFICLSHLDALC